MIVSYCTFEVGGSTFGIPVGRVQEVVQGQRVTPVPLAPSPVAGLVNLRGRVVTALDLRRRLGAGGGGGGDDVGVGAGVVVTGSFEAVCLLVDRLGDVVEVERSSLEPPPPAPGEVGRELIAGSHRLGEGTTMLVLDVDAAVEVAPGGRHATHGR